MDARTTTATLPLTEFRYCDSEDSMSVTLLWGRDNTADAQEIEGLRFQFWVDGGTRVITLEMRHEAFRSFMGFLGSELRR